MLILDLWDVSFHAAVVFGLGKDFLFKSTLGHCVMFVIFVNKVDDGAMILKLYLPNKFSNMFIEIYIPSRV